MSMYSDLAAVADELLAEFGRSVTIRSRAAGNYDPETGSAALTTTDQAGNGAVFDFESHQSGTSFTAGTMILAGDKQLLLSPVGISEPSPGDLAITATGTWNIAAVKSTAPAGVAVLYECLLRK